MRDDDRTDAAGLAPGTGTTADSADGGDAHRRNGPRIQHERALYLPLYAAGVPVPRSLVWAVSLAGLGMVLAAILT